MAVAWPRESGDEESTPRSPRKPRKQATTLPCTEPFSTNQNNQAMYSNNSDVESDYPPGYSSAMEQSTTMELLETLLKRC